jgi:hypothetical protein
MFLRVKLACSACCVLDVGCRFYVNNRLDADLQWYQGQYEALEALVEALRSPDRWLAYRAEALLDSPRSRAPRPWKAPTRS